jgi:hypothetical protein
MNASCPMAKFRRATFEDLLPRAWDSVGEWANKWSERPLPVPLEELAMACKVRRIEFEPLLSTGGLEEEEDGFVVFVNTEADGVDQRDGDILEVSQDVWRQLRPPLRFTLAHELAHLLFWQIADRDMDFLKNHERELETVCNQMAGMLLLPKTILLREVGVRLFDADHLRTLLKSFHVSADTFVFRLKSRDLEGSFKDRDGMVGLARANEGGLTFDAVYMRGPRASIRWEKLANDTKNATLDDLYLGTDIALRILEAEGIQEKTSVVWHSGAKETLPCELTTCRLRRDPLAILIAIGIEQDARVERKK